MLVIRNNIPKYCCLALIRRLSDSPSCRQTAKKAADVFEILSSSASEPSSGASSPENSDVEYQPPPGKAAGISSTAAAGATASTFGRGSSVRGMGLSKILGQRGQGSLQAVMRGISVSPAPILGRSLLNVPRRRKGAVTAAAAPADVFDLTDSPQLVGASQEASAATPWRQNPSPKPRKRNKRQPAGGVGASSRQPRNQQRWLAAAGEPLTVDDDSDAEGDDYGHVSGGPEDHQGEAAGGCGGARGAFAGRGPAKPDRGFLKQRDAMAKQMYQKWNAEVRRRPSPCYLEAAESRGVGGRAVHLQA